MEGEMEGGKNKGGERETERGKYRLKSSPRDQT